MPPMGVRESCMAITAPQEVPVVATVKEVGAGQAETELPYPPYWPLARRVWPQADCRPPRPLAARQRKDQKRSMTPRSRPPLAGIARHDAECVGEGAANQENQEDLR